MPALTKYNKNIADELVPTTANNDWKETCRTYLVWGQWRRASEIAAKEVREGRSWLLSVPFDGDSTVTSFSGFGVNTAGTTFRTQWDVSFQRSVGSATLRTFLAGELSWDDTNSRIVIDVSWTTDTSRAHRAGIAYREPGWAAWPVRVVYDNIDKAAFETSGAVELIEAIFPQGDAKAEYQLYRRLWASRYGPLMEKSNVPSAYADQVAKLAEFLVNGDINLTVAAGMPLGKVVETPSSGDLEFSFWLEGTDELLRFDPAYYLGQHCDRAYGLSGHPEREWFWDHRGVVVALDDGTASGTGEFQLVSGTNGLQDAIDALEGSPFATVIIPQSFRVTGSAGEKSLITVTHPVNIVGHSPTRMLRATYRDVDGVRLETDETLLDVARSDNPGDLKLFGELVENAVSGTAERETRLLELSFDATASPHASWRASYLYEMTMVGSTPTATLKTTQPWQPTREWGLTTGVGTVVEMPVIVGGASEAAGSRYRCMLIEFDDSAYEGAFISIANIAFAEGAVQVDLVDPEGRGGGGICISGTSRVRVVNCLFADCGAAHNSNFGSAGNFQDYMYDGAGGGLFWQGASPLIEGCYFQGRETTLSNTGDGMAAWEFSYPVVVDCVFYKCEARAHAGLEILTWPYPNAYEPLEEFVSSGYVRAQGDWDNLYSHNYLSLGNQEDQGLGLTPSRVLRCLFDSCVTLSQKQDGANFYCSAGAVAVCIDSVFRHGRVDHGGANVTCTFGSELVLSGCKVQNGHAKRKVTSEQWDGGGVLVRNSDLLVVVSLTDGSLSSISGNQVDGGRGGGIKFLTRPNWNDDLIVNAFQTVFDNLELVFWRRRRDGPRSKGEVMLVYTAGITEVEARLLLAGVEFDNNLASDTTEGKGGACFVLNRTDSGAGFTFSSAVRMVEDDVSDPDDVDYTMFDSTNQAAVTTPSTDFLWLDDQVNSVQENDSDLTRDSGTGNLTSEYTYDT